MTMGMRLARPRASDPVRLVHSFGIASLVVLLGVGTAWLWVKRGVDAPVLLEENLFVTPGERARRGGGVQMLLDQAGLAYAAGRILEPRFDNALYFYQTVLNEDPSHREALIGLAQVLDWLGTEATAALAERDLERAQFVIAQIAALDPGDDTLAAELRRLEGMIALDARAGRAMVVGDLQSAGESFARLLEIDPEAADATAGMGRVVADLASRARNAANRGDLSAARAAREQAARFGADTSLLESLAELIAEAEAQEGDLELESRILAAARALEAGRLMPPVENSAWSLYSAILGDHPDHAGARAGILEVRGALFRRLRDALAADDLDAVPALLEHAKAAGGTRADVRDVEQELEYRQYLVDMRRGQYREILSTSDFEVLAQRTPLYPRGAVSRQLEGWVDLEFTVTATGQVEDVQIADSSAPLFHQSSIDALSGYRFVPHDLHGRPVPVRAALRFNYQM